MSNVRVLVFGATGYTGRYVIKEVCRRGLACTAHIRPDSPRTHTVGEQIRAAGSELACVPWEAEPIQSFVARVAPTHVFTLLGITRAGARRESARTGALPTYAQVDTGYTHLVLDAVEAVAPEARVVYLSSLGADKPGASTYLQARHLVETRLLTSPLDYTIARPSFISGADRDENRLAERLGSVVSSAMLGVLGTLGAQTLQQRLGTVSGAELGQMLVAAALDPTFGQRVVDMVDLRNM